MMSYGQTYNYVLAQIVVVAIKAVLLKYDWGIWKKAEPVYQ